MKRRRQIFAFLGILFSFMALLSLLSYSAADQAAGDIGITDLWKVLANDEALQARARATDNLLGLAGAIISNALINSTIGYAVLVLPLLGFLWAISVLRRSDFRRITILTNYALGFAFLFSALCGTVRLLGDQPLMSMEWSGTVGDFLASVSTQLIGVTGTLLLLLGTTVTLIALLADLDLAAAAGRLKGVGSSIGHSAGTVAAFVGKTVGSVKGSIERRSRPAVEIKQQEREAPARREDIPLRRPPMPVPEHDGGEEIPAPAVSRPALVPEPEAGLELSIKEKVVEEEVDFDARDQDAGDEEIDFVPPSVDLLEPPHMGEQVDERELKANAELLRAKLLDFGVTIESVSVTPGPVVTLYELVPAPGVKISKIESLEDDIALALKAKGIRIIAPIPGKGTVGVEIPNHNPSLVRIRGVINSSKFRDSKFPLPIAIGKTISGEVFVDDLSRMPHLLIAGATGSGKSVGINVILTSFIYRIHPTDVKFVIIDPKKIELSLYAKLARHYLAVSPDVAEEILTTPPNAVLALKSVELEMERRYDRLAAAGVRNISDYNERLKAGRLHDTETVKHRKLPYLIVIIDELADLMITAAREVEEPIARLAQLARAVGIHLVLATQRPSVDVITGVIKANFPARIAYQVASKTDSRTILDMNGAEQLLGNGDMLYLPPGSPKPVRIQNAFISTDEVERIVMHIAKQKGFSHPAPLPSVFEKRRAAGLAGNGARDDLFEEAARLVVRHQQGSVSLLQRRLKVGYSRAARLVDELEAAGIVGPFDGSKAREVLVETDEELTVILRSMA